MSQTVAIIGAGGKMGQRAAAKLRGNQQYLLFLCERDEERAAILQEEGLELTPQTTALGEADLVVMSVPDSLIGVIGDELVLEMKPGAVLIMLDAAAAYVGELPMRKGLTYMITHPCHPGLFIDQATPEQRQDYFGGLAIQDIIVSLVQGQESKFSLGVELCKAVFAPVRKVHRVTLEQFAILEPAMSEVVVASAACLMKEALEMAIQSGVPREAAEAFMWGHTRIALAIAFGVEASPFSDAAKIAIEWGSNRVLKPNWREVFRPDQIREAVHVMLRSDPVQRS
jgi:hypothetical protein